MRKETGTGDWDRSRETGVGRQESGDRNRRQIDVSKQQTGDGKQETGDSWRQET